MVCAWVDPSLFGMHDSWQTDFRKMVLLFGLFLFSNRISQAVMGFTIVQAGPELVTLLPQPTVC